MPPSILQPYRRACLGFLDSAIGKSIAGQASGLRLRRGEGTALSTLSAIFSASALALHQSV